MNTLSDKKAFTLAEVLTTLMLVGVIAAVTIPVLNHNVSEETKIKSLRIFNNAFNQNILTTISENACDSVSCLNRWGNEDEDEGVNTMHNGVLERHLKFINKCVPDTNKAKDYCLDEVCREKKDQEKDDCVNELCKDKIGEEKVECLAAEHDECSYEIEECYRPECVGSGCWGNAKVYCDVHGLNCKNVDISMLFSKYLLNNAMSLAITDFPGNCVNEDIKTEDGTSSLYACSLIYVDVNGAKGPNKPGNDVFAFYLLDKPINNVFLFPFGGKIDLTNEDGASGRYSLAPAVCDPNSNSKLDGFACTAKNLKFGIQE